MNTRGFLKPLQHFFATRHLLKPNVTYPLYSIFVSLLLLFELIKCEI